MNDEDAIRARYRELCAMEPRAAIDELGGILDGSENPREWFAVYMHKLELEQSGRSPYAMGFEKHILWMVSKAKDRSARLQAEEPNLEAEAMRLVEIQKERPLSEDELYEFVSRFTGEELAIVGF